MVFTKEDKILIKVLRQSKGYSARKLLEQFPDKDLSCSALNRLPRQIDAIGSARQQVRHQQRTYGMHRDIPASAENIRYAQKDMQVSVQIANTLSTNCN